MSVGFIAGHDQRIDDADGRLVERVKVKQMPECLSLTEPAYPRREVLAVRAASGRRRTRRVGGVGA